VGEDSINVLLRLFTFWVQVHDLLIGLFLEPTAKQLGDFVGEFLEYDSKSLSTSLQSFVLIRVLLDVRRPLKRRKRIMYMSGQSRRTATISSFWLKEEGEGELQGGRVGRENKKSVRKGSDLKMDLILGINLDEDVRDTFDMVGNMVKNKGHVDMDHDGEENPIEGGEDN
ncbi:hypothetical protein Goari_021386, partial [Gossypium aridum]|nr:hypothetical protein [Gossypium aridum]